MKCNIRAQQTRWTGKVKEKTGIEENWDDERKHSDAVSMGGRPQRLKVYAAEQPGGRTCVSSSAFSDRPGPPS